MTRNLTIVYKGHTWIFRGEGAPENVAKDAIYEASRQTVGFPLRCVVGVFEDRLKDPATPPDLDKSE